MSLRVRLLLWVSSLLMILVLFLLFSTFFIRRDIQMAALDAKSIINANIEGENKRLQNIVESSFAEAMQELEAILFLFGQSSFRAQSSLWENAADLLSLTPDVNYAQVSDFKKKKSAGIFATVDQMQTTQLFPLKDPFSVAISTKITNGVPKSNLFLAYFLKTFPQDAPYYALLSWDRAREEISVLKEMELNFKPREERLPKTVDNFGQKWAILVGLIHQIASLQEEKKQPFSSVLISIPDGVAFFSSKDEGFSLFADDVLRINMADNLSQSQFELTKDPFSKELFITDSSILDTYEITIGSSLKALLDKIATSLNGQISFALEPFTPSDVSSEEAEFIYHLGDKQIQIRFTPRQKEKQVLETLQTLDVTLSRKILMQLSLLFALCLVGAFIILEIMGRSVTKPIIALANAAGLVSEGKFDEIIIPKAEKRKDEIGMLTRAFSQMVQGLKEREKIRAVLNKVVSKEVADEILRSSLHLGGEDREVTMLFSDIREFTKLSENRSPQEIIELLNTHMTKMSRIIEGEGGVIDKYVGDEIMALFGAPTTHPDHAIRALSAAKLMIETQKKWNEERIGRGESPFEMGIGIHTGVVVVGNMGAEERLNYTVLGSNVNLAARLCQIAPPLKIIISESTLNQPRVKEYFYVKELEPMALKGFKDPIKVFEITGFKWTTEER